MSEIKITKRFWADPRLKALKRLLGEREAIGEVILLWHLAEQHWRHGRLITEAQFKLSGLSEALIDCEFAMRRDNGIYCKGAKTWFKKSRSAVQNGTKGGRPRRIKHLTKPNDNPSKPTHNPCEPNHNPMEPIGVNALVWAAYSEEYFRRWKTKPLRNATVNAQVNALVKRIGESAVDVIRFYVRHNEKFYVQKMHPIGLALKDAEGLHAQWATGTTMTHGRASQADKAGTLMETLSQLEKEE